MAEQQPHRFPKPWQVFEDTESFGVADANGDSIAFVYAEANRAAYFNNPKMMKDDARRIAHAIARIPELLEIEKRARGEMPDIRTASTHRLHQRAPLIAAARWVGTRSTRAPP